MIDARRIVTISEYSKLDLRQELLPFFISSHVIENKLQMGCILYAFISEEKNCVCILNIKQKYSFFKLGQFEYPPVTMTGERLSSESERDFMDDVIEYIREKGLCDQIICPPLFDIYYSYPSHAQVAVCKFGNFVIPLEGRTFEQVFLDFNSNYRVEIRKAEKEGLTYQSGYRLLDVFYNMYSQLMRREEKHIEPKILFESLLNGDDPGINVICASASLNEQYEGVVFIPFTKYLAYYFYGASASDAKLVGSNKYLQAEAIKELMHKGVKKYSLGGCRIDQEEISSKIKGIQDYKRRFGAEIVNGYLWKAEIKFKARIYNLIFRLYTLIRYRRVFKDMIDQSDNFRPNG
jgi:hypothetical protein